MRKQKTTMIEVTDDELWLVNLGLSLLKDSEKIIPKRRQQAASLGQKLYKIGILVFRWERK